MKQYFEAVPVSEGLPTEDGDYFVFDQNFSRRNKQEKDVYHFTTFNQEWHQDSDGRHPQEWLRPLSLAKEDNYNNALYVWLKAKEATRPTRDEIHRKAKEGASNDHEYVYLRCGIETGIEMIEEKSAALLASRDEEIKRLREALEKLTNESRDLYTACVDRDYFDAESEGMQLLDAAIEQGLKALTTNTTPTNGNENR